MLASTATTRAASTGFRITVQTDRDVYFEGEAIYATLAFRSASPQWFPWPRWDLDGYLQLDQNGIAIPTTAPMFADVVPAPEWTDSLDYRTQLVGPYASPETTRGQQGGYLLPGQYTGYFRRDGLGSPAFRFLILAAPDSLREVFAAHRALRTLARRVFGAEQPAALLDSTRDLLARFTELPANYPWRLESLLLGVRILGAARPAWSSPDSLAAVAAATALAFEERGHPGLVIDALLKTTLASLSPAARGRALLATVAPIPVPRLQAAARRWADTTRSGGEQ